MTEAQSATLITAVVAFLAALTAIAWQVNALLQQQRRNHEENRNRLDEIERKVNGKPGG